MVGTTLDIIGAAAASALIAATAIKLSWRLLYTRDGARQWFCQYTPNF